MGENKASLEILCLLYYFKHVITLKYPTMEEMSPGRGIGHIVRGFQTWTSLIIYHQYLPPTTQLMS